MKIIFLDIDGVLNAHEFDEDILCGQFHKDKVQLLNHVLRATDARIVLSSAWRYLLFREEMTLLGLEWLLRSHGVLANRLIGITRKDTMSKPHITSYSGIPHEWPLANERGEQISDWLKYCPENYKPTKYAAIDDIDLGIRPHHPLVLTDGSVGMTQADAEELIELLN